VDACDSSGAAAEEDAGGAGSGVGDEGASSEEGATVVYCVIITTGGTESGVVGDPAADVDGCAGSWPTAALVGNGAIAEVDDGGWAIDCASDCSGGVAEVGVGNTVVYSVSVTKTILSERAGVVALGVWMLGGTPGPATPVDSVDGAVVPEEIVEF
jgi:hypothetical protein